MTNSYVGHDSFICVMCVTWFIHMCDTTHLSVWHILSLTSRAGMCNMTPSTVCATWLIHTCNTTHSNAWHDTFEWVTYEWVMSPCYATSHSSLTSHMYQSYHTYQWIMSHEWYVMLHARHVTHSYVQQDSLNATHSYEWHVMWCFISLAAMCHITRPYMSFDSITQTTHCNTLQHTATHCNTSWRVMWLVHTCHWTQSHVPQVLFTYVTPLTFNSLVGMRDMTPPYVPRDSFEYVTELISICNRTDFNMCYTLSFKSPERLFLRSSCALKLVRSCASASASWRCLSSSIHTLNGSEMHVCVCIYIYIYK